MFDFSPQKIMNLYGGNLISLFSILKKIYMYVQRIYLQPTLGIMEKVKKIHMMSCKLNC